MLCIQPVLQQQICSRWYLIGEATRDSIYSRASQKEFSHNIQNNVSSPSESGGESLQRRSIRRIELQQQGIIVRSHLLEGDKRGSQ